MNAQTNLPAERRETPPLVKLASQLDDRAAEFRKVLPSHITPSALQRTIITAAQSNPDLLLADRQSLITACMKAAQDGLLPDGREAALVIFSNRVKNPSTNKWESRKVCQYMPMVYGLRKKIIQSGEIVSLQTGLVYRAEMQAGAFLYEVGMEPPIRHRPMLDLAAEDLTDDCIVAAYSMAKMKDGTISIEVMRRSEIDKVREVSQTGAVNRKNYDGSAREAKGPWVDWFGEMARKTVMRRHSKTLPMSGDVLVDVEGRDMEAASSVSRVLEVEPDAPIALPSADDLAGEGQVEQHDPETGEVLDERGMTVVDEDTARELDARMSEEAARNLHAIDGVDDKADDADAGDDDTATESEDPRPMWERVAEQVRHGIGAAKTKTYLAEVDKMLVNARAAMPDTVVAELEALIAERRRAIAK